MKSLVFALVLLAAGSAWALDAPAVGDADREKIRLIVKEVLKEYAASLNAQTGHEAAKPILKDILQTNRNFARTHKPGYFEHFVSEQHPRATVVTCSDSRVHTHALDVTPDGDLFMVRNIGNQIATAEGSVEYGVHHLHTPLLLIVGHTACGAIKAAAGNYSTESGPIKRELDSIAIPKDEPGLSSVKLNVHNQVKTAMNKFEAEVLNGHLTVVGAVYDFTNEMRLGQGRLHVVNVNGETDAKAIAKMDFMQEEAAKPVSRPHSYIHKPAPMAKHEAKGGHDAEAEQLSEATHETKVSTKPGTKAKSELGAHAKPAKKLGLIKLPEKPAELDVPSNAKPEKLMASKPAAKPAAHAKPKNDEDE